MKHFIKDAYVLFLLLALSFIFSPLLHAQDALKVVVEGTVVDQAEKGVPFARIKITPISGDSTQYYTQVADQLGAFRIALSGAGEYRISISMVGMDEFVDSFTIPEGQKEYSLGKLKMEEAATVLDDVTITATKKLVKIESDKISYEIKDDPESKSSNLLKMLRKVPLVTVDAQGNIQVNGSSSFKIYRNGKEDKMLSSNAKDILKSIPASTIKSIEVITDAGVKFDAESSGAILNIITEKGSALSGIAGTASVDAGSYGNYQGSLFLNAKVGKVGLTGNMMYGLFGGSPSLSESSTTMGHTLLKNNGDSRYNGIFKMFNGTISYEIDSLNLLSLSARGMPYTSFSINDQLEQKWEDGTLVGKVNNKSNIKSVSGNYSINMDFQHNTTTPGELITISYMFDRTPNNYESNQKRQLLDLESDTPILDGFSEQISRSISGLSEHTVQIDYTRPFKWSKRHNMESGVKFIARRSLSTPEYLIRNNPNDEYQKGSIYGQHLNSSVLNYGQNIYALYMSWTTYWNSKFSTNIGTRLENSGLDVKYTDLPEANFKRNNWDLVPQLRLSYNFTPFDQSSLSYNFRIRRPGIYQVNPYRMQTSEYRVSFGNPDLEAQRNHSLGFKYGHFSSKFTLNASINYNFSNNAILEYSQEDPEKAGIIQQTHGNLGKNQGWSFGVFANYSPWTWLRVYVNGNVSNGYLTSKVLNDTGKWSTIFAFGGANITLPKSWSLSLSCGGHKFGSYQFINEFSYFSNINLGKSFLNDKLSLQLSVIEPFRSKVVSKSRSFGKGFETNGMNTNPGARMFSIGVSYRFGELKERIKSVSKTISNTDLMEGGGSGGGGNTPTGK